jgi:hypothetical protein
MSKKKKGKKWKKGKASDMPKVIYLKTKHEKRTGVPNDHIVDVFHRVYKKQPWCVGVCELADSIEVKERFRKLLGPQHAGAPLKELGMQLFNLRKRGRLALGEGNDGPGKGFRERRLSVLRDVLVDHDLSDDEVESIVADFDRRTAVRGKRGKEAGQ